MKGLFVVVLCATVGYCVKGSPLPAEVDSTVESTDVREAKELPVPGRFQGGFIKPKARINPFLQGKQQQTPSGVPISGVQPQVNPVLQGTQQQIPSGVPISGVQPQVNPVLQGTQQQIPSGVPISGVRPQVNPVLQGTQQQIPSGVPISGVRPQVNPVLQGTQQQIPSGVPISGVRPQVNPVLQGTQQQIPSGVPISGVQPQVNPVLQGTQQTLPVDSQGQTADAIASRNAEEARVKDTPQEKPIEIVSQNSDLYPDGSHFNVWESANGIKVQEEGTVKVNGDVQVQSVSGSVSYTDADGTPIHLTYVADENGFQPQGDHLPTPPPIPQSVARALEYIAAHPWVEEDHVEAPSKVSSVKEVLPVVEVA